MVKLIKNYAQIRKRSFEAFENSFVNECLMFYCLKFVIFWQEESNEK